MAVQGFVLVLLAVLSGGALAMGLPPLRVLDVSVAGFLAGMGVGRWGCLFGGCCAGRPSGARWAVWSSNRSCGVRRIPTQIFEATGSALLAVLVAVGLWTDHGHTAGLYALVGFSAYTALRQILFPLRENAHSRQGRLLVLMATGSAVVATVAIFLRQG